MPTEAARENPILAKMLERLFAGLLNGPNLNCRPHYSRQRIDIAQLRRLDDVSPEEVLRALLGGEREAKFTPKLPPPPAFAKPKRTLTDLESEPPSPNAESSTSTNAAAPDESAGKADEESLAQRGLLNKLRIIADEARTYEQDTGVHVLNVGFPLLSLPPGGRRDVTATTKRVLAPLAFIPVTLEIRQRPKLSITLACRGDEIDRVVPNEALLAWLNQQAGRPVGEVFADERGDDPWREIQEIAGRVAELLKIELPPDLAKASDEKHAWQLAAAPRTDDADARPAIVMAAVLGLFPMNNQGLIRDTQAMLGGEAIDGPVQSFLSATALLDQDLSEVDERDGVEVAEQIDAAPSIERRPAAAPRFAEQRMISVCDPCQARAVRLARECGGLVIHGPPGTGKSQTIANIIGDHLARGQRVLMVCDKRTALDVVANRLEHLGLGNLVALIHDPQRDQRDLYRSIREQLENLAESPAVANPARKLAGFDKELTQLHDELTQARELLQESPGDDEPSFHELVGEWLACRLPDGVEAANPLRQADVGLSLDEFSRREGELLTLLRRAESAEYHANPWAGATACTLDRFLTMPLDELRAAAAACVTAATALDETLPLDVPAFSSTVALDEQVGVREQMAAHLQSLAPRLAQLPVSRLLQLDAAAQNKLRNGLALLAGERSLLARPAADPTLEMLAAESQPTLTLVSQQIAALESYLQIAERWYAWFCFSRRSAAKTALHHYGKQLSSDAARALLDTLLRFRGRRLLQSRWTELASATAAKDRALADAELVASLAAVEQLLAVFALADSPAGSSCAEPIRQGLQQPGSLARITSRLKRSSDRAAAIVQFERSLIGFNLLRPDWQAKVHARLCAGSQAAGLAGELRDRLPSLETVIRAEAAIAALPTAFQPLVNSLLKQGLSPDDGLAGLRKQVLGGEIGRRVVAAPGLLRLDEQQLNDAFDRYRQLDTDKRTAVRQKILHRWTTLQKERLLASTGSRLSTMGADLKRRLTLRGERALRLRQVIDVGRNLEGGDPLFDLRPVWMASPETVAQVLPRTPLFDVVIFDEASQCRLEEALPVLTRARRVVIAGDPKQLPPTRFFESAIASSEEETIETEQQLFEAHQSETEDLLGAALGLEIQQCYLDVHYRSANADLIAFSNEQFYGSRLQPIPGHPRNRARFAPISLLRAGGVYHERTNAIEADAVCRIVHDLLRRAEPPSIGVACFNITQRDLISERLDELAAADADFATRLAEARVRRGSGSFEGLFVKNLENVQGDERDHIIISTTYGPDQKGKFYRRFGPLGRAGGGRRLNVLVTRARHEVHLVTSIPAEIYRTLPPVPSGQAPTGAWLLFAYLQFAEKLASEYAVVDEVIENVNEQSRAELAEPKPARRSNVPTLPPLVSQSPSLVPSQLAAALGGQIAARQQLGAHVNWGNDGFCVDVAVRHPHYLDDVTIGLLVDTARYPAADDPIEWDIFRSGVLRDVGWTLERIWSPMYVRDPSGMHARIERGVAEYLKQEDAKDGLRVSE